MEGYEKGQDLRPCPHITIRRTPVMRTDDCIYTRRRLSFRHDSDGDRYFSFSDKSSLTLSA